MENPQNVVKEGFVPSNFFRQSTSKGKSRAVEGLSADAARLLLYNSTQQMSGAKNTQMIQDPTLNVSEAGPPNGPTARSAHDTALVTSIFSFGTAVVAGLLAVSHLDGLRPTMSRLESATALMLVLFALIAFGLSVTVSTYDSDELTAQGKGMSYSSTVFAAAAVTTIAGVLAYVKFVDKSAINAFPWTLVGVMVAMLIAGILSAVTTSQAVR